MLELHCVVSGRVQGVMYRDFATRNARRLGLVGWVKNLPDGTVELLAQGERDALERLLWKLRRGPLLARVDSTDAQWREMGQPLSDFVLIRGR